MADDFHSFWPDDSRYVGRPTALQIAEQPATGYKLSECGVMPVEADTALVTYFADIRTPGVSTERHMAVGEVWVKRERQWFIRAYSGTLMK